MPAASWRLLLVFVLSPGCRCQEQKPRAVIDFHTHIGYGAAAQADQIFWRAGVGLACRYSAYPHGRRQQLVLEESRAMRTPTVVFAGVPWRLLDEPDFGALAAEDLRRSVAAGARGLKITKALGLRIRTREGALLAVDDPRLDPIWATAGKLGIPVAIHTGDPVAFFEPVDEHNERREELLAHPSWSFYGGDYPTLEELLAARDRMVARHPQTNFVAVHVGGLAEDLEAVSASVSALPNLYIDVAARLPEIGRHPPAAVREFFVAHQDRILFGTDIQIYGPRLVLGSAGGPDEPLPTVDDAVSYYGVHWRYFETADAGMPHLTPIQGRWTIDAIDLPAKVLDKLYRGNAEELLGAGLF